MNKYGPQLEWADKLHAEKYRGPNESFEEAMSRIAGTLSDNEEHRKAFRDILLDQRFMPGGRIQSAIGSTRNVCSHNCFVSGHIEDNMQSIMTRAAEAAETMRQGGGIGYDFSRIRPEGDRIVSLGSRASGPISFMGIYDAICETIASAGHRRGAQMGVLRVDHPDIEKFIRCKQNQTKLKNFNISVGITDEFMEAVEKGTAFTLRFEGRVYNKVDARALWNEIMRATWDWAEPGVLFIDRINNENNLWYVENIEATNPCAEQPLPPYGACLLGSFNLPKYLFFGKFNFEQFKSDIVHAVRAMDNVIDVAKYPLPMQEAEAKDKRRMGLGITGLANTVEALGFPYGSIGAIALTKEIMKTLTETSYRTSVSLAVEKGPFPLFDVDKFTQSDFLQILPIDLVEDIHKYGIRNSHLISIAPTGTISLTADNVSSGIEPVFSLTGRRIINTPDGEVIQKTEDYGYRVFGVKGKTADQLTVDEHLDMLLSVVPYVDSAVSKTLNVGEEVSFDEFKNIYWKAYKGGAKGCTTFRAAGKRFGILLQSEEDDREVVNVDSLEEGTASEGTACYYDPETGMKSCE